MFSKIKNRTCHNQCNRTDNPVSPVKNVAPKSKKNGHKNEIPLCLDTISTTEEELCLLKTFENNI